MAKLVFLTEKDIPSLFALHQLCFPKGWSQDFFQSLFKNKNLIALGHYYGNHLISFLLAQGAGGTFDILTLGCHPAHRRQHYGADLLTALIKELRKKKTQKVFLEVKNNNLAAISLYEKNGFKKLTIRKNYYTELGGKTIDGFVMSRVLHED